MQRLRLRGYEVNSMNELRELIKRRLIEEINFNTESMYNMFRTIDEIFTDIPKHETVEELREAYEKIKDSHTEYGGDYSTCIHCNEGGFGIIKHKDDCIVIKANRWLFKNGKPKTEE